MSYNFKNNMNQFLKNFVKLKYNITFNLVSIFCLLLNVFLFNYLACGDNVLKHSGFYFHLVSCVIIFLPQLFFNKKEVSLAILAVFTIYLLCNLLYYRAYFTLLPLDAYKMTANLKGLSESILNSFRISDFLFIIPALISMFSFYFFFKKRIIKVSAKLRIISFASLTLFFALHFFNLYSLQRIKYDSWGQWKCDLFRGECRFGFVDCWYWQFKTLEVDRTLTKQNKKQIESWLASQNHYIGKSAGKQFQSENIIYIIVESLESFPVNLSIHDVPITPNLNKLVNSGKSIYFPNVVSQVKGGRSSDAQIILNSGLLPPNSGAACFRFANNKYLSLAKCLHSKGYNSCTFTGGDASFWNEGVLNKDLGYDNLISINNYINNEFYLFGLTDSTFLSQTAGKIAKLKRPFFAQLITMSSHDPYYLLKKRICYKAPDDCPEELGRYLNTIHYADKCIGEFLDKLDKNGILKNSRVIITGDHEAYKKSLIEWNDYVKKLGTITGYTPLIIYNAGTSYKNDAYIGQIDIYTSLLDLMGLNDYGWKGLGHRVFYSKQNIPVVDAWLNVYNKTISDSLNVKQMKESWKISDLILKTNYFNNL